MCNRKILGIYIFLAFLVVHTPTFSQTVGSPYSSIGIGLLHGRGMTYHNSMGGLGISNGNSWTLNNINPALLPINTFTTFEAGMTTAVRNSSSESSSIRNVGGNLSYLALGFPIKPGKWTMAIGMMPYSNVNYKITTKQKVINDDTDAKYSYNGAGGYNHVYLSSGWKVVKSLYFGVRLSYIFSEINDQSQIVPFDTVPGGTIKRFFTSTYTETTRFNDFLLQGGLVYAFKLNDKSALHLGTTYELGSNIKTFRSEIYRMKADSTQSDDEPFISDTTAFNERFSSYIPQRIGLGISVNKFNKWTLGADVYFQNWEKYKNYNGENEGMNSSYKIIFGGEWTPEYNSVSSYLKRITFQLGFYYENTPYFVNNTNIRDFGMNFGLSLPVGAASLLNFGFNFGTLGAKTNELIRDDYFKFTLGLTFNDRSFGFYRNQRQLFK